MRDTVALCAGFQLSLRDIEELLFERGVTVTCETIRCWCDKFGKSSLTGSRLRDASRVAHGTSTRCSSRCVANRTYPGDKLPARTEVAVAFRLKPTTHAAHTSKF
ncbi:hypothetical protein QFZ91_000723 [Paraburkholderia sp. JPY419]